MNLKIVALESITEFPSMMSVLYQKGALGDTMIGSTISLRVTCPNSLHRDSHRDLLLTTTLHHIMD